MINTLLLANIIINIPHSSTYIPKEYRKNFVLKEKQLGYEAKLMADMYTNDICDVNGATKVISPVSRLVVDIERFANDEQESMSKIGMGAVYTKTSALDILRKEPTKQERDRIMKSYYYPHHSKLYKNTKVAYEKFHKALVIDCHSFSTKSLPYEGVGKNRPQICIGTDDYHTDQKIAKKLYDILSKKYEVEFNQPFSGSIVPIEYYGKNKNIQSIMIEIRKDNYMNEQTFEKHEKFNELKADIQNAIIEVSEYFNSLPNE